MVAKRRGDTVIAIMPTLWNLVPGVGPTAAQGGVVTLLTLCRPSPDESCLCSAEPRDVCGPTTTTKCD
jgi:hypothetical protein